MKVQVYSSSEPTLEYNQNQMNQAQFERNQDQLYWTFLTILDMTYDRYTEILPCFRLEGKNDRELSDLSWS